MSDQYKIQKRKIVEKVLDMHDGIRTVKHQPHKRSESKKQLKEALKSLEESQDEDL